MAPSLDYTEVIADDTTMKQKTNMENKATMELITPWNVRNLVADFKRGTRNQRLNLDEERRLRDRLGAATAAGRRCRRKHLGVAMNSFASSEVGRDRTKNTDHVTDREDKIVKIANGTKSITMAREVLAVALVK